MIWYKQIPRIVGPLLGVVIFFSLSAQAHRYAPALLELQETGPTHATVRWKQPMFRVMGSELRPVLPGDCEGIGRPKVTRKGTGMEAKWEIECSGGLVGKTVGVEGIASSQADVLLRIQYTEGRSLQHVLTADQPSLIIPEAESWFSVVRTYSALGIEHILTGFDHLLFVLGLTLLVGAGRKLIWTVTAFTVGHSITLGLATLGYVNFPPAPIEAGIALSIYILAVDLAASRNQTVLRTYPWAVAALFGLLHGFGFAGALAEVGLPEGEIPLALFSFNVGIEFGQLAFVVVVLIAWTILLRLRTEWPRVIQLAPAYAIGSLAAFWFFERSWIALLQAGWFS